MVKTSDPRLDRAAISMRTLRASKVFKHMTKTIEKPNNKSFDLESLKLQNLDYEFYEEFKNSSESIRQELLFLWEEVGALNKKLEELEINEETNEETNEEISENLDIDNLQNGNENDLVEIPIPKKMRLFGP